MRFSVDEKLFTLFPGLKIGALVCEIDNTKYGEDRLEAILEEIRNGFSSDKPQDHSHIKVWREAFRKLGIPAAKYYSSIESLLRRVLKGGPFPRINPIVDLYNAMSLKYLVPIGGHDIGPLDGDIALAFATGNEPFTPMDTGEQEFVDEGEVVYKDEKEVLTRRWVWRQSNKDKTTAATKLIFIPVDVMEGLEDLLCERVMADIEETLLRNGNGRAIHKAILTKERAQTQFQIP
jgi:DNA/RNA-binding domain of Phe-tRNA-synthetase-like protein